MQLHTCQLFIGRRGILFFGMTMAFGFHARTKSQETRKLDFLISQKILHSDSLFVVLESSYSLLMRSMNVKFLSVMWGW
jgi:hypothetical protein